MKRYTSNPICCLILVLLCLSSCKDEKIEHFKLSLIFSQDIGLNKEDPLDANIRSICSYYTDTACSDLVFVPDITISRIDMIPEKSEPLSVPLSSLNNWRKSMNMLSAVNLMEDYHENIPQLKVPGILTLNTDQAISPTYLNDKYPSAIFVSLDSLRNKVQDVINQIGKTICENATNNITIVFYQNDKKHPTIADLPDQPIQANVKKDHTVNKIFQKPASSREKKCPSHISANLVLNKNTGEISCNTNPGSSSYHYFMLVSESNSFNTLLLPAIEIPYGQSFPSMQKHFKILESIKLYANLYFRYEVICGNTSMFTNTIGPLKYGCGATTECKLKERAIHE